MFEITINAPKDKPQILKKLLALEHGSEPLMKVVGRSAANTLQDHFLKLNRRPNRRGWRKSNFWARIRTATHFVSADATTATVGVADPAFAAKVHGAVIRPKQAKALAIPLTEMAYGKSPRSQDWGAKLSFIPRKNKPSLLAIVLKGGEIHPQYVLLKQTRTPADPKALPSADDLWAGIAEDVNDYLERLK